MTEDEAFVAAILEATGDDAPRLVYADWLEEHGEPARATALRLDCAWRPDPSPAVQECRWGRDSPPPERRYPPALLRLTEAAEAVPLAWLARVSRVGAEVRGLVERFAALVPVSRPAGPAGVGAGPWQEAVRDVRRTFAAHVGGEAARRLLVPVDYALFAAEVGGLDCPEEYGMAFFDALFGPERMAEQTASFCDMYAKLHGPGEQLAACGLWLFAGYSDKHDLHVCCDRASPLYGVVADQHDSHPWIRPPHGPVPWEVVARCFLDYLRLQVAVAKHDGDDEQRGVTPATP